MKTSKLRSYLCYGLAIILCAGSAGFAFAQGLGSLGSLVGGGGSVDINALADKQSALTKRLQAALTDIIGAQIHFANALGNKEEAAKLQVALDSLTKGNTDEDTICKAIGISESTVSAQAKKLSQIKQLDALQKQEIQKGLVPYAKGTANTVLLGKDFAAHLKATQGALSKASVANVAQIKNKLGLTLSVAPRMPGLGSAHASTATTLVNIAKSNNLSTKEAEKALGTI